MAVLLRSHSQWAGNSSKRTALIEGGDLNAAIKKIQGKDGEYSSAINKVLKKYGDLRISGIEIKRAPVSISAIIKLGEKLRAFDMKSQEYSKLYHLYMIIGLENGKKIIAQKNEVLDISVYKKKNVKGEEQVSMPSYGNTNPITLSDFLSNGQTEMGDNKWFNYSPLTNNCQDFLIGILEANPPLGTMSILTDFVKQDVGSLVKSNTLSWTMKAITDTAGVASTLFS